MNKSVRLWIVHKNLLNISLAVLFVFVSGCENSTTRELEECQIYRSVIESLQLTDTIAILENTAGSETETKAESNFVEKSFGPLMEEDTYQDYKKQNQRKHSFDPQNCLGLAYVRLTEKERVEIFEQADGWNEFHNRYPNSANILVIFSKVGFDPQSNQAIVFMQRYGEHGSGDGRFVFLEQSNDQWVVKKTTAAWIT